MRRTVNQPVDAVLIPDGTPITLQVGTIIEVLPARGQSLTLMIGGNMARISIEGAMAGWDEPAKPIENPGLSMPDGTELKERVIAQIKTCFDPEISVNIYDLGLIYDVMVMPFEAETDGPVADDTPKTMHQVHVVMTLTAPGCGMGPFIVEDVKSAVSQLPSVAQVEVELVFDPPWTQEQMSEAAKLELGLL